MADTDLPEVAWLDGKPVAMLGALSDDTRIRWDDLDVDAFVGDMRGGGPPDMNQPVIVVAWPDGTAPEPPEPDPFAALRSYVQSWKDNAALAGKVAADSARPDGLWDAYDRVLRKMDKLAGGES